MPSANQEVLEIIQKEFLASKAKNSNYSLRALAKKLGLFPSALSEVLNGKRRITKKMAGKILDRLPLDPSRRETLLGSLAPPSRSPRTSVQTSEYRQIDMDHFHILSDWYYFAVYTLAETVDFRASPDWIADRLRITRSKAKLALDRLVRVGLFKRTPTGQIETTGSPITTSHDIANASLRLSHLQNLEIAKRSLEEDEVLERDFSSITMATSPSRLEGAKEKIKTFRRELCAYLESVPASDKSEVFQLNVQLFPLTKRSDRNEKN